MESLRKGLMPAGEHYLGMTVQSLVEAMRKGCVLAPTQSFGAYLVSPKTWPTKKAAEACALGAAFMGLTLTEDEEDALDGRPDSDLIEKKLYAEFPVLSSKIHGRCPLDGCNEALALDRAGDEKDEADLDQLIAHFNDDHKMPREAIADYLEAHFVRAELEQDVAA